MTWLQGACDREQRQRERAAERIAKVLLMGGRNVQRRTVGELNEDLDENRELRQWVLALEDLKRCTGLQPDHLGKILDNCDYADDDGEIVGNLLDFMP